MRYSRAGASSKPRPFFIHYLDPSVTPIFAWEFAAVGDVEDACFTIQLATFSSTIGDIVSSISEYSAMPPVLAV